MNSDNTTDHLTDLELAAYIDRGVSAPDYARAESHLADCGECRDHLVETRLLLDRRERPKRFAKVFAGLAAAAVVGFLLVNPRRQQLPSDSDARLRAAPASDGITAYGPMGELARSPIRFVWASTGKGTVYRLTVNNAGGEPLWSASTTDSSLVLPGSVTLTPGEQYFWTVDALTADGRSLSTGLKEFSVAR